MAEEAKEEIEDNSKHGFKEIWSVLSKVDCNERKKALPNGCTYLSWSWAWEQLMAHYPQAEYSMGEVTEHGGTIMVWCSLRINGCERTMWLPAMTGYSHAAKKNPDARDVGDARMRCLVKAIAMFGLGYYIYAGEDLPRPDGDEEEPQAPDSLETFKSLLDIACKEAGTHAFRKVWKNTNQIAKEEVAKCRTWLGEHEKEFIETCKELAEATDGHLGIDKNGNEKAPE